jgi:hypothetical protein
MRSPPIRAQLWRKSVEFLVSLSWQGICCHAKSHSASLSLLKVLQHLIVTYYYEKCVLHILCSWEQIFWRWLSSVYRAYINVIFLWKCVTNDLDVPQDIWDNLCDFPRPCLLQESCGEDLFLHGWWPQCTLKLCIWGQHYHNSIVYTEINIVYKNCIMLIWLNLTVMTFWVHIKLCGWCDSWHILTNTVWVFWNRVKGNSDKIQYIDIAAVHLSASVGL